MDMPPADVTARPKAKGIHRLIQGNGWGMGIFLAALGAISLFIVAGNYPRVIPCSLYQDDIRSPSVWDPRFVRVGLLSPGIYLVPGAFPLFIATDYNNGEDFPLPPSPIQRTTLTFAVILVSCVPPGIIGSLATVTIRDSQLKRSIFTFLKMLSVSALLWWYIANIIFVCIWLGYASPCWISD